MSILSYIKTFVTAVNNASFIDGTDAMHMPKLVVSKPISKLEHKLGVILLLDTTA